MCCHPKSADRNYIKSHFRSRGLCIYNTNIDYRDLNLSKVSICFVDALPEEGKASDYLCVTEHRWWWSLISQTFSHSVMHWAQKQVIRKQRSHLTPQPTTDASISTWMLGRRVTFKAKVAFALTKTQTTSNKYNGYFSQDRCLCVLPQNKFKISRQRDGADETQTDLVCRSQKATLPGSY